VNALLTLTQDEDGDVDWERKRQNLAVAGTFASVETTKGVETLIPYVHEVRHCFCFSFLLVPPMTFSFFVAS
jgi:hypothetical protein